MAELEPFIWNSNRGHSLRVALHFDHDDDLEMVSNECEHIYLPRKSIEALRDHLNSVLKGSAMATNLDQENKELQLRIRELEDKARTSTPEADMIIHDTLALFAKNERASMSIHNVSSWWHGYRLIVRFCVGGVHLCEIAQVVTSVHLNDWKGTVELMKRKVEQLRQANPCKGG